MPTVIGVTHTALALRYRWARLSGNGHGVRGGMSFDNLEPQTPMQMPAANAYAASALARSRAAPEQCRTLTDVSYGSDPKHRLDVYLPRDRVTGAPVLIFLHGGSWTHGYKEWMGFMGPALVDLPAIFIAANYRLAP